MNINNNINDLESFYSAINHWDQLFIQNDFNLKTININFFEKLMYLKGYKKSYEISIFIKLSRRVKRSFRIKI